MKHKNKKIPSKGSLFLFFKVKLPSKSTRFSIFIHKIERYKVQTNISHKRKISDVFIQSGTIYHLEQKTCLKIFWFFSFFYHFSSFLILPWFFILRFIYIYFYKKLPLLDHIKFLFLNLFINYFHKKYTNIYISKNF